MPAIASHSSIPTALHVNDAAHLHIKFMVCVYNGKPHWSTLALTQEGYQYDSSLLTQCGKELLGRQADWVSQAHPLRLPDCA